MIVPLNCMNYVLFLMMHVMLISAQASGQSRYKTCTRCKQQFDEYTKGGCKSASNRTIWVATILEGRWMCCRQQGQELHQVVKQLII